ncbi:hypothetical protein [Gordonia sp. ABSL49_1]|uniref:hypothetical protein n=1 Tax=Gordonia sp. ABSL49_1 TaxID=2920941 RepID=UPI001F1111BB|nr:hypothetical protein [Gordonia sp. ABSL49_1]MCH5644172.1 hypothetical protein [Gordonia sp. ABSL49_1]
MRRAAVALGAGIAIGVGSGGAAYAESINSYQISQNSYSTVENLIVIADNLGRTQIALLAPIGSRLPEGWVPVVTSDYATNTEQLNFIEALTQGGALLLAVPDSSHVPGASTALSGISPLAAQVVAGLPLAGTLGSGATVYAKMFATWIALNGINVETVAQNFGADLLDTLGQDKVTQHAGVLEGIPSLDQALGFWTGNRTTSNWTGNARWLGATTTSWIKQDQVTMNGITSGQLKALFAQSLNTPDALVVANGSNELVQTGVQTVVIIPAIPPSRVCIPFIGCVNYPGSPAVTEELPIFSTEWIGETDADGNQVHTTIYDPNDAIPGALAQLDDINVGGFSITQREAGGTYTGPLGGKAGWLGAATQVVVPGTDGKPDYVATVPIFAAGVSLPDNLFTTGMQLSPGLVTTTGQSVNTTLGSRSSTVSIPGLGFAAERTSLLESSHLGPDGFSYNSGWTIATIKVGDAIVPLVYSLGSVNFGPNGIGLSGPSFMGVGLEGFQLGTAPSTTGSSIPGDISGILNGLPTTVITLTPKLLFQLAQIEDPTNGVLSDPIGTLEKVLNPLFTKYVTPTATQISQALADAATEAVNNGSDRLAAASRKAAEVTGEIAQKVEAQPANTTAATPQLAMERTADDTTVTPPPSGRHARTQGQNEQNDGANAKPYVGQHRAEDKPQRDNPQKEPSSQEGSQDGAGDNGNNETSDDANGGNNESGNNESGNTTNNNSGNHDGGNHDGGNDDSGNDSGGDGE